MIFGFQFTYNPNEVESIKKLSDKIENNLRQNASYYTFYTINNRINGATETVTYRKQLSKDVMDDIDNLLKRHYGLTEEELDFIINYDIKYRMGDELNENE